MIINDKKMRIIYVDQVNSFTSFNHSLLIAFHNNLLCAVILFRTQVCLLLYQLLVYPFRIEKMWVRDGAAYFFGPIFIHPEETEHEPTKMFYKKEVFLSNLEETCPMTCILGSYLQFEIQLINFFPNSYIFK